MWNNVIAIAGSSFGFIGCVLAVWIAYKQNGQLRDLKKIGYDTHETAKDLRGRNFERDVAQRFFQLGNRPANFRCLLPVGLNGKLLPSIQAGDYHALHILQDLLGNKKLGISFQGKPADSSKGIWAGDSIFLCSPQANHALQSRAPFLILGGGVVHSTPRFDEIELPCWFANSFKSVDGEDRPIKLIGIVGTSAPLESPCEGEYLKCRVGAWCEPSNSVQEDYAIVLRLTLKNGSRVFVFAGIHQYGTWIAGEFLSRLATEDDADLELMDHHRNAMLGDCDFIAILCGKFDTKTLLVKGIGVHDQCIWTRNGNTWVPVRHASKSPALKEQPLCDEPGGIAVQQ